MSKKFLLVIATMLIMSAIPAAAFQGPLRVSPTNPRYFTDDSGKAIYVTGSHTWGDLIDIGRTDPPTPFDFPAYLSFLLQNHHNFVRFWTWTAPYVREGAKYPYEYSVPQPWLRTGPGIAWDGKPQFDLNSFNEEYFSRLRQRVIDAGNEGIYVDVTLFEGWWFASQQAGRSNDGWSSHPFRSVNNINGIDTDTNGDGYGFEFYTLDAPPSVIDLQKAYVSKILDTVNDLDNVLYEIVNEADQSSVQWQYMMIDFVKQEMAARGKSHPVGMTSPYFHPNNTDLFNSPADWISPNASGGYKTDPSAANGTKVIVLDSDHLWDFDQNRDSSAWVWKGFTRGTNVIYMDDPAVTTTNLKKNRKAMGDTLRYAEKMDLNSMLPSTTLCSTAYCLQNPGKEYLVYQPSSGRFNLTVAAGTYSYEWFNPNTHAVAQTGTMTLAGGSRAFTPPFSGTIVLHLKNMGADIVIDDSTAATSFTGLWGISGGTNPYGSNSLWSRDGATYTWTFTPTASGSHQLSMWWTSYSSRSSSVPVDIAYAGGSTRVYINQRQNGGKWNVLGTYSFEAGKSYKVTITSEPGPSSTCADAVKFSLGIMDDDHSVQKCIRNENRS